MLYSEVNLVVQTVLYSNITAPAMNTTDMTRGTIFCNGAQRSLCSVIGPLSMLSAYGSNGETKRYLALLPSVAR